MTIKLNFWVDIEDASGNKLGAGPIKVSWFAAGNGLSEISEFQFPISPGDPNFTAIAQERRAFCRYLDDAGVIQLFGGGIIKKIQTNTDNEGLAQIMISGPNIGAELDQRSVKILEIGDSTGGDTDAPDQIMALAPSGWTISGGSTTNGVYIRLDGQSVLNALSSLSEATGEHWRLGTGRQVVWIGSYSSFAASGVRAIGGVPIGNQALGADELVIIKRLKKIDDSHELVTRIYPRGAGNGDAILRFEALTDSAPVGYTLSQANNYVENDAAVIAYDNIEREIDFKNTSPQANSAGDNEQAANQLLRNAVEYLRRWSAPQYFYELELAKTEVQLLPGTTIKVVYKNTVNGVDVLDIDQDLNIINVTERISADGLTTIRIQVSTIDSAAMNDQDFILGQLEQSKISVTHPQRTYNARSIRTLGEMDDSYDLTVPLFFDAYVSQVNKVIMRFQILPLRSTITGAASGGGSTTPSGGGSSTPSGGGSTTVSGGGSTSGDELGHNHLYDGRGTGGSAEETWGASPLSEHSHSTPSHAHATPNHSHSTPDHTHSTPNHTHGVAYGIFEESGANTLVLANLSIKVNGGSELLSSVTTDGDWYVLDLTDELIDSAGSPDQVQNDIVYATGTAKTARILSDISLLETIQPVRWT